MSDSTPGLRKAHKRYVKAVEELELATLARWEQKALVDAEQEYLVRLKDAEREWSAEVERRRDALVEAAGRAS